MSTILNTLKKLEEEKSILEKNIDLKGLLLQGQEFPYPQAERQASKKWQVLGGLIAGGVLLGGFAVYYFYLSKPAPAQTENSFLPNKAQTALENKKPLKKPVSNPGIPLAGIPETEPVALDDSLMDDDFFGPEEALPPEVISSTVEVPPLLVVNPPEPEGSAELREIETLIQSATTPTERESQNFENQIAAQRSTQSLPGVKLKGIIFFSPDDPANHVFVATDAEQNLKLKVGDTVSNAILESIEAQKAVFSYQGQRVETVIGG